MHVLNNYGSTPETIMHEVDEIILPAILRAPSNPVPYNFLRGLYFQCPQTRTQQADGNLKRVAMAGLIADHSSLPAMELLADYYTVRSYVILQ